MGSSVAREHKHVFVLLADGVVLCQGSRDRRAEIWRSARELTIMTIT